MSEPQTCSVHDYEGAPDEPCPECQWEEKDQRIQDLEAQCAAMRDALLMLKTGDDDDGPCWCDYAQIHMATSSPECRAARAALATDAGKAMLAKVQQYEADEAKFQEELGTQDAEIHILRCRAEKAEREAADLRDGAMLDARIAQARFKGAAEMKERAAKMAESYEPGLSDEPSGDTLALVLKDPVIAVRSAVAVTKRNIAAAIRALPTEET